MLRWKMNDGTELVIERFEDIELALHLVESKRKGKDRTEISKHATSIHTTVAFPSMPIEELDDSFRLEPEPDPEPEPDLDPFQKQVCFTNGKFLGDGCLTGTINMDQESIGGEESLRTLRVLEQDIYPEQDEGCFCGESAKGRLCAKHYKEYKHALKNGYLRDWIKENNIPLSYLDSHRRSSHISVKEHLILINGRFYDLVNHPKWRCRVKNAVRLWKKQDLNDRSLIKSAQAERKAFLPPTIILERNSICTADIHRGVKRLINVFDMHGVRIPFIPNLHFEDHSLYKGVIVYIEYAGSTFEQQQLDLYEPMNYAPPRLFRHKLCIQDMTDKIVGGKKITGLYGIWKQYALWGIGDKYYAVLINNF